MYELTSVEAIGLTVDDAIARGLDALNATRDQVTVVVIDQGGRSAPGQRPREARVRLTLKEDRPQPAPARPKGRSGPEARPPQERAVQPAPAAAPEAPLAPDAGDDEVMRAARDALQELLTRMKVRGTVSVRRPEPTGDPEEDREAPFVLDIRGDDLGVLIGRRGETLTALQYLTRMIACNQANRNVNLVVDVEGYKARREQQLRQLAQRMAERVATTRKPVALEPMPAYERRIIHLALRDHPVVTTESVGRDEERKVTIILKSRRRSG